MKREQWLIWIAAAIILTLVLAAIGYLAVEQAASAGEALAVHIECMTEDGEPIPPPSGFAEVIRDNPDAMTVLVPFPLARTVQRG